MFRQLNKYIYFIFLVSIGLAGWCREINIRLVDAKYIAPVEFWKKNQELPDGMIYYRFPDAVYIDGQAIEYAAYGGEKNDDIVDDQMVPEPKVNSDLMQAVMGDVGVKARVTADIDEGAHVVLPGELKFNIDNDVMKTDDPAFLKKSEITCYMLCYPVDINLLQAANGPGKVNISVNSGGQTIFKENFSSNKPMVLRLYLPVSAAGYTLVTDRFGKIRFTVAKDGVKLQDKPADINADVSAFNIALQSSIPDPAEPTALLDKPADNELYIFTDRNRRVYLEGEQIQISLRAWGDTTQADKAEIWLEGGTAPLPLGNIIFKKYENSAFAEAAFDTAMVCPGKYNIRVKAGNITGNPLPIEISPLLPETNMKIFTHLKWGDSTLSPEALEKIPDLGFNWMSNSIDKYHGGNCMDPGRNIFDTWQGIEKDAEYLKDYRGQHFPAELSEKRSRVSLGMESMLSRGVQFLSVHNGLILYFNVGDEWRDQADDRYQASGHMATLLRRYPNFAGFTYCTGDGPTPATMGSVWGSAGVASFDVLHKDRMKKLRDVFETKFGKIGVDLNNTEKTNDMTDKEREEREKFGLAWGFKVGEDIKMQITGDDDKGMLWGQWINDLYPDNFRVLRKNLEKVTRNPIVTCGSSWGIGAGGGLYPGTFYRALDFAINDYHGDYGVCPSNEMTGTDIMTMGMEEPGAHPWVGIDLGTQRENDCGFKVYLQSLSRNPSGIGALNIGPGDWVCGWAKDKQKSEALTMLTDISKRFGDIYTNLERNDEIAIVSSMRQEILGGQPFRAMWAAHYLTQKSGYQANIVTDAYCIKHPDELAKRFKAILLFRMTKPLSAGMKNALAAYRKAGGAIIVDKGTTVEIEGAVKLPFIVPDSHGPSNTNDHLEFEEFFLPFIKQFRDTISPVFTPYFSFASQYKTYHHDINWNGIRSQSGDLEYWIITNDGKPKIEDGVGSQFKYEPDIAAVTAAGNGILYDALRRVPVKTELVNKQMQFTCDGSKYAGTIYLFAPRPVKTLAVAATSTTRLGQLAIMRVQALDPQGKAFTGMLPVEIVITDPAGVIRYRIYRTTNTAVSFKIAANDAAGIWKWQVNEQATGLTANGTFTVIAGDTKPKLAVIKDNVSDADAVYTFLKRPVTVVLSAEETALKPQAEQLVKDLIAKGVTANLQILWPARTVKYPVQWDYKTMEDKEVHDSVLNGDLYAVRTQGKNHFGDFRKDNFGTYAYYRHYTNSSNQLYYRDIILLGRDDVVPGPLMNTILRARMLLRNPSESYPAKGQGMIGYAFSAFQARYDTVVLYGSGKDGLNMAIADLLSIAGLKDAPKRAYMPPMARTTAENGGAYKEMGIGNDNAGAENIVKSDAREISSLLPAIYAAEIADVTTDDTGKIFIRQNDSTDKGIVTRYIVADAKNVSGYRAPDALKPATAAAMSWHLSAGQGKQWHAENGVSIGGDYIVPADFGIGRFKTDGTPVWFYDPFPAFNNYNEAKFPRRAREYAVSGDGSTVLAAFYSKTPWPEGSYQQNRSDAVMIDAATGKEITTIKNYYGSKLLVAKNGARAAVADLLHSEPGEHNMRDMQNRHDRTGLVLFDRGGQELSFIPISRTADTFTADDALSLVLVTYSDAARRVTVVDLNKGTSVNYRYSRADFGVAAAPDGTFAAVVFSDGLVVRLERDGTEKWRYKLPVAGKPVIQEKEQRIVVACPDGTLQMLDYQGKLLETRKITVQNDIPLQVKPEPLPATLEQPVTPPWWDIPQEELKITTINGNFNLPEKLTDELTVKITIPKTDKIDTLLATFNYRLNNPDDRLLVTATCGKRAVTYPFAGALLTRPAVVPLRFADGGEVTLTFKTKNGVVLNNAKLRMVDASAWSNAAATKEDLPPSTAPRVRLMVPNVFGLIGDPRAEQVASGLKETKFYNVFDKDVLTGTSLYDIKYPQNQPWFTGTEKNLRSAFILFEYKQARTLHGIGLWTMPGDLPIEAWTLECCDSYKEEKQMTHVLEGNWKLIATGRGNYQPYLVQTFTPVKAKIWRFTITRTPATMQNMAEIELYEDIMDVIEGDDEEM